MEDPQKNKGKGEVQMTNHVTIGAVTHTHTHTHTQANLVKSKKINIYTIFMCFLYKKLLTKNI